MLLIFSFLFCAALTGLSSDGFLPFGRCPKTHSRHTHPNYEFHSYKFMVRMEIAKKAANLNRAVFVSSHFPADRVFSLRQSVRCSSGWNAANCDAEQTVHPSSTILSPPVWLTAAGKDEPRFCSPVLRAASTAFPASQGVELNQLSLKVCKLVMLRRDD